MSKLVGLIFAGTALLSGMLFGVDPLSSLWRSCLAYFLGWAGCTVWIAMFSSSEVLINNDDSDEHPLQDSKGESENLKNAA